ncbi:MAG: phenylalanine--tRNA ligase subunit alpha [Gemmatimonadaceae bacterium]
MISSISDFASNAGTLVTEAVAAFDAVTTPEELEATRIQYLGDRSGRLRVLQHALASIPKADKPMAGRIFNEAKVHLQGLYEARQSALKAAARGASSALDLTMPARHQWRGAKHPVTLVIEEIVEIFRELGFTIALGPQVETEWYNFGALNFPPDHPALDAHDTLYLRDDVLLRTHTSPVQMRTLQRFPPPIRVLAPGDVFRRDFFDASHAPMFSQIEGLCVDEGISFVDLKAMLTNFARRLLGTARTRFRPSYFPFTEPSAEMDVECQLCRGSGCPACKGTGWSEILGSGMVHPSVLEAAGVDAERYTGWAFGMGPGRIAMQRYDIPDIRILYDSDVRFLEQIARPVLSGAEG